MPTMYDTETPAALPADAEIVAGYVDGNWPDYDELVAAFPDAKHVSITTSGRPDTMVGDCEKGDMTPTSLAAWAHGEVSAGRRPVLYYAKDSAGAVATALNDADVELSAVDYWVADWTGEAHVIAGTVATQWASPGTGSGGNFDISETIGSWPVVPAPPAPEPPSPGPVPAPSPPLSAEEEIVSIQTLPNGQVVVAAVGAGSRAGHLLVFTLNPTDPAAPGYNVLDVTDGIGTAEPYTVSAL